MGWNDLPHELRRRVLQSMDGRLRVWGATHHAGTARLIHTLPPPWSQWVAQAAESFTWYSPLEYVPRGDLLCLLEVILPALVVATDGPPRYPPPQIFPPDQALLKKYRYDKVPHVSRVPKRARLRMRTSAPPRMDREVDRILMTVPSPVHAEEEDEEEEEELLEEVGNLNMESVGETEEEEEKEE